MDARQLRHALAVLETGSLGRAASLLHISQPALTKSIQRLESELQVQLFIRDSRGMYPTRFGEWLRPYAQSVTSELSQLATGLTALRTGAAGLVSVAAPPLMVDKVFPAAIGQFRHDHPAVQIRVETDYSHELFRALLAGRFDFIAAILPTETPHPALEQRFLFNERLVVAARAGHPATKRAVAALRGLQRHPWILPVDRDYMHGRRLDLAFEAAGLPPIRPIVECDSSRFALAMVATSDYLTLQLENAVPAALATGKLSTARIDSPFMVRPIGLVWRRDQRLAPASAALLAAIAARFKA